MSDNPLDHIPSFDRISIRAVVVMEGEDPGPALAAAGIVDPIAVPIVIGEQEPDRSFGDGFTPNVIAVLEFDQEEDGIDSRPGGNGIGKGANGSASDTQHGTSNLAFSDRSVASRPGATKLPAAFGVQPLAPVRDAGIGGRQAHGASASPPTPGFGGTEPKAG